MNKKEKIIEQKKYIVGIYKMMYAVAGHNIIIKGHISNQSQNDIYGITVSPRKLKLLWASNIPALFYDLAVVPIFIYLDNLVTNFNIALSKEDFEKDNLKDLKKHKKDTKNIKFIYTNNAIG